MSSFRALARFVSALLVVLATSNEPAHAWRASKLSATGPNPLIVKIEGRKGTRIYTPDEAEDYAAVVEAQEKAAATHEQTAKEKLDQCMASWDTKTHITKANWRKICERQLSDGLYDFNFACAVYVN